MLGETRLFRDDPGHEPPLEPPLQRVPLCPVCGRETWELVRDQWGDVFGCPECVSLVDAEDGTELAPAGMRFRI